MVLHTEYIIIESVVSTKSDNKDRDNHNVKLHIDSSEAAVLIKVFKQLP